MKHESWFECSLQHCKRLLRAICLQFIVCREHRFNNPQSFTLLMNHSYLILTSRSKNSRTNYCNKLLGTDIAILVGKLPAKRYSLRTTCGIITITMEDFEDSFLF
ncbi:hypothetical protein NPIL_104831 [Nephila pilipes]|uniref:Uncharacterized protein n=1 Tax=Nephila pilipes TaxID=299642 RepID=A0A8X6R8L1_NEPPI|nr:hypothetical protein NPIL_104831 [Nephila pilipes]